MLKTIDLLYRESMKAIKARVSLTEVRNEDLFSEITRMKYDIPNENYNDCFNKLNEKITVYYSQLIGKSEENGDADD